MDTDGADLVLGATSLVGRRLLPSLEGRPVVGLSRNERPPTDGVRWVVGDLTRPETVTKTLAALGPIARVFSCGPIWLLTPEALAALRALGMARLVAFSSTSVLAKAASASAHEQAVARALAAGEAAVEAIGDQGVGWTVIRPTLIYAEGEDGNVSRLAGLIRRFGVLPLAGAARGLRQPVHAEDLADLAIRAMAAPAANRAYAAPGGDTLSYRAMAERVFEGMDRRPRLLTVPEPALRLAFAVARPLLPGADAEMIGRMNADLVFDGADARRDFGWSPRPFTPTF